MDIQSNTLTAPGSKVWDYTYDVGNRLTRVDIPNGMHTEYTYDASGCQDSIHHKDGATVKQGDPRGLSGAVGATVGGYKMITSRAARLGDTAIRPSPAFKNAGRSRTRSGSRRTLVAQFGSWLFFALLQCLCVQVFDVPWRDAPVIGPNLSFVLHYAFRGACPL
jgi:YD repeat-containing protein